MAEDECQRCHKPSLFTEENGKGKGEGESWESVMQPILKSSKGLHACTYTMYQIQRFAGQVCHWTERNGCTKNDK